MITNHTIILLNDMLNSKITRKETTCSYHGKLSHHIICIT